MKKLAVIPARFASTRFPGKPLIDIAGQSMIERVYRRVFESEIFNEVLIATDDVRILSEAKRIGAKALMTKEEHSSGTDRCLEAYEKNGSSFDVVLNVQGDEPFVDPSMLRDLCSVFTNSTVQIATAVRAFETSANLEDPNKVKAILKVGGEVDSFSRSKLEIPSGEGYRNAYFKHIGVYAFRPKTLKEICALAQSPLELKERLEQLRWMENGYPINAIITDKENPAIDTPADLDYLLAWMRENRIP